MNVEIKDWTFTHWWVRPVVKIWFEIYHKSVTYSGIEHIDWQKPIIFVPSHQNAFSDALCLILPTEYTGNRFIYPLIRADAFGNSKAIDWILTAFHMMPVYRSRDNVNLKQQNESVFAHCHQILFRNSNLLIHAEGNCIPKKKVGRLKKGPARIAFGAGEQQDFNLDLTIIPVGINYRAITEARKGIHVRFGEQIAVSDYQKRYQEHKSSAITALTRAVEKDLKNVTVDIKTDEHYCLAEQLLQLKKNVNSNFAQQSFYTQDEVASEKKLLNSFTKIEKFSPGVLKEIQNKMDRINAILDKHHIERDQPLAEDRSKTRLLWEGIGFLAVLPLFLYGWINNIFPWMLMHKAADMVKEEQFRSSARMLAGLLVFPVCYILQSAGVGWLSGSLGWMLSYLLLLPITGIMSLNIWEKWKTWKQQLWLNKMPEKDQTKLASLTEEIFQTLKKFSISRIKETS